MGNNYVLPCFQRWPIFVVCDFLFDSVVEEAYPVEGLHFKEGISSSRGDSFVTSCLLPCVK